MKSKKAQARRLYRAAWQAYLFAPTKHLRLFWEQVMDQHQAACTSGPNPGQDWQAFIATLPGYESFWARVEKESGKKKSKSL